MPLIVPVGASNTSITGLLHDDAARHRGIHLHAAPRAACRTACLLTLKSRLRPPSHPSLWIDEARHYAEDTAEALVADAAEDLYDLYQSLQARQRDNWGETVLVLVLVLGGERRVGEHGSHGLLGCILIRESNTRLHNFPPSQLSVRLPELFEGAT